MGVGSGRALAPARTYASVMPVQRSSLGFRPPTPVVRWTLIVLGVLFVGFALAVRFSPVAADVYRAMVLDPTAVLRGQRPWTLLTYALLHSLSDPQHILFNALGLYFFASDLEELWGQRRFVLFMIASALAGGVFVLGAAAIGLHAAPVVGASGIVVGCVVAWGLTFREREMLFFFVRMRGITLVWVTFGFEVLNAISLSEGVSAAAHFGGMAAGAAYVLGRNGSIRRAWLRLRLRQLESRGDRPASPAARRGGPPLRIIHGGGDEPPKDKRYLN
jgi:membrane associated rhomboid family serine protease